LKIAVIGAGPAGMAAAYELIKKGVSVEVFEKSGYVGGMSRTIQLWNQRVDMGPHRFFSNDPRVNRLWSEMAGNDYDTVKRLTRILYKEKLFHYPLKPINVLVNLGVIEACRCLCSYCVKCMQPVRLNGESSFEQWVTNRFGERLFHIFFKTYSEKLWGIPCSELDADFAVQRIKNFSLSEAVKTALGGSKNKHKTLVDQFAYPHGGSGMIYERMAARYQERGGILHLHSPIQKVIVRDQKAVGLQLEDGRYGDYDHIISTLPITHLAGRLDEIPQVVQMALKQLKFRNTILVFLRIAQENLFPDNWLYVHSSSLKTGRITNFRNWTSHLYGQEKDSILALEYWCYDEDRLWCKSNDELIELASTEIRASGLIGKPGDYATISGGHVERLARSYPVYTRGYQKPLAEVENFLRGISGLSLIGRYGAFKYNNQDHSILMGLLAAENIANGTNHDLWRINTDYEYQEAAPVLDADDAQT
jgi:protoporphyrinogen oxidase